MAVKSYIRSWAAARIASAQGLTFVFKHLAVVCPTAFLLGVLECSNGVATPYNTLLARVSKVCRTFENLQGVKCAAICNTPECYRLFHGCKTRVVIELWAF